MNEVREKAHKLINELTCVQGWLEMETERWPNASRSKSLTEAMQATKRAVYEAKLLHLLLTETHPYSGGDSPLVLRATQGSK
jgi:hypothetical protein